MTDVVFKDGTINCVIAAGTLADPYTGTTIDFVKGGDALVDIDHVVALGNAWETGAQNISEEDRRQLANDPLNLLSVDGPANRQKGDADAATWLPANTSFRCHYVALQTAVKQKYELWMTAAEREAIIGILSSCPDQLLPTQGGVPGSLVTPDQVTPGQTPTSDSAASSPAPAAGPTESIQAPTSGPVTVPSAPPGEGEVVYANCAEVKAAGAAPIRVGDAGFRDAFDRDGNGIGCES